MSHCLGQTPARLALQKPAKCLQEEELTHQPAPSLEHLQTFLCIEVRDLNDNMASQSTQDRVSIAIQYPSVPMILTTPCGPISNERSTVGFLRIIKKLEEGTDPECPTSRSLTQQSGGEGQGDLFAQHFRRH